MRDVITEAFDASTRLVIGLALTDPDVAKIPVPTLDKIINLVVTQTIAVLRSIGNESVQ